METQAKTAAQRQRAYRERLRENGNKPVNFVLESDNLATLETYAQKNGISKNEALNALLKKAESQNTEQLVNEINKLKTMAFNCFVCSHWSGETCSYGLTLEGFVCRDFEDWKEVNSDNLNRIEELKETNKRLQEIKRLKK
jgi:hypothetical protein